MKLGAGLRQPWNVFRNGFVGFLILMTILVNLDSFGFQVMPARANRLINLLNFRQRWELYTSILPMRSFLAWSGTTRSGTTVHVSIYGDDFHPSPQTIRTTVRPSRRWARFERFTQGNTTVRFFADYLCRKWNSDHQESEKLDQLALQAVLLGASVEGVDKQRKEDQRATVWTHDCSSGPPTLVPR
jgi:hypothetical protein